MATPLRIGQQAPLFTGVDGEGNTLSLQNFRGRKVILYFYPQDDTPTCTVQACNLRDNYTEFQKEGYEVIGISPDDIKSHQKFKTKFTLPFSLITDPEHKIIDKYGVWGEKNLYGRRYMGLHRTTFIINEDGIIENIILHPKSKTHAAEILRNQ